MKYEEAAPELDRIPEAFYRAYERQIRSHNPHERPSINLLLRRPRTLSVPSDKPTPEPSRVVTILFVRETNHEQRAKRWRLYAADDRSAALIAEYAQQTDRKA